jgi:class 3 adenylate cyclase
LLGVWGRRKLTADFGRLHVSTGRRLGEGRLSEERVERRLAAILAADVVGYSRLMGEDEEAALISPGSFIWLQ